MGKQGEEEEKAENVKLVKLGFEGQPGLCLLFLA